MAHEYAPGKLAQCWVRIEYVPDRPSRGNMPSVTVTRGVLQIAQDVVRQVCAEKRAAGHCGCVIITGQVIDEGGNEKSLRPQCVIIDAPDDADVTATFTPGCDDPQDRRFYDDAI